MASSSLSSLCSGPLHTHSPARRWKSPSVDTELARRLLKAQTKLLFRSKRLREVSAPNGTQTAAHNPGGDPRMPPCYPTIWLGARLPLYTQQMRVQMQLSAQFPEVQKFQGKPQADGDSVISSAPLKCPRCRSLGSSSSTPYKLYRSQKDAQPN